MSGLRPRSRSVVGMVGLALVALLGAFFVITAQSARAAEAPVNLRTASSFAVLAGSTVTNTGDTLVSGDLGVSPGTAITGFPPGQVINGTVHAADAVALQAQSDLTTAYNDAAGRSGTPVATELGGRTLVGGVYSTSTEMGLTGTLTLDGQGDASSVFIFQAGSTLITASNSTVALINGAQACNVYWQVGSSATLGTGTSFVGTVMALTSISLQANATVQGRLLARNGAVTLIDNTITRPFCTAPTPTVTGSASVTPTATPTASVTATPTASVTPTATPTASVTATPTASVTATPTASVTATPTASVTATPTASVTATPTASVTATPTASVTATPTASVTATPTASVTATPTPTRSATVPGVTVTGTPGDSTGVVVPAGRPDTGRGPVEPSGVVSGWSVLGLAALLGSVLVLSPSRPRGRHH